jgi:hypothetical protein
MTKQEILLSAKEQRTQEVLGYQINIDNYTLAIEQIGISDDPDLADFKNKLIELLKTEKIEQKKTQIILTVVEQQLQNM